MAIKNIPMNLLIHSISYEKFIGSGQWDDSFDTAVTINNVRVEPINLLKRSSQSEGEGVNHIVFVDRKHSSSFPNFVIKSRITFNGVSREIVNVKALYGFDNIAHHYEIELK